MKQRAPAAERNQGPIGDVLAGELPERGWVLEVASGTGQHAVAFGRRFPHLEWQPSDVDPGHLASISAWIAESGLSNVRPPLRLDAAAGAWDLSPDAIYCANMVHITPWEVTQGLLENAQRVLPIGGLLFLYGPYTIGGEFNAESNAQFDASLRQRDSRWGIRDLHELESAAPDLELRRRADMPANNYALVFRRRERRSS